MAGYDNFMENLVNPNNPNFQKVATEINTVNQEELGQEHLKAQIDYIKHSHTLINKIIAIFLGFQSLLGIYSSIKLILFERTLIESQIVNNNLTSSDLNQILGKAVLTLISTMIGFFFAIQISFLKSKAAQNLQTAIGIFLIVANGFLLGQVSKLPLLDRVMALFNF